MKKKITQQRKSKQTGKHRKGHKHKFSTHNRGKTADDEDFDEVGLSQSPEVPGMGDSDSGAEDIDTRKLVQQQNRKKKKSGGFQSMGLSFGVYKGVMRKGYKVPTPIQRKAIPLIMDGKDVVAMARTGSGKTAAFLIPMLERLKTHSAKSGARALVLSPTRELALQTLKFAKELGKFTGLKTAVILGGDKMEDQFAALHENPDIIVGTPGRFMHVLVEMELKLHAVEYVVFDEADRLFEMGFQEQLTEILSRLPESRQTLLFSATLPKLLVDFARAGLHDPTLVRLDVDTKLSENLKMAFLQCRVQDKTAVLLHLLRNIIKPAEQTLIFAATKHHVEYLNMILTEAGIKCSYSYSSLDQTARKINVAKFRNKKCMVLLVTDLAARGIDIPLLDNVINYNFPAKPKLFVHRVGRVARAGRSGTAYSLVSTDEMAYVLDLHLFLGRSLKVAEGNKYTKDEDSLFGLVPQTVVDDEEDSLRIWSQKTDVFSMEKVINNAYKQYIKSRPVASSESIKRAKELSQQKIHYHPLFDVNNAGAEEEREKFLDSVKNYRPNATIFEINSSNKSEAYNVMKEKRKHHKGVIQAIKHKKQVESEIQGSSLSEQSSRMEENTTETMCSEVDLKEAFSKVVAPKKSSHYEPEKKKKKRQVPKVDEENYLHYKPKDFHAEKALSLTSSFEHEAAGAVLDFTGDDDQQIRKIKGVTKKWDRKRKRFVTDQGADGNKKKVKTESGRVISASYKSNLYKEWLEKSKARDQDDSDDEENTGGEQSMRKPSGGRKGKQKMRVFGAADKKGFHKGSQKGSFGAGNKRKGGKGGRSEIKGTDQILKARRKKAKEAAFQHRRKTLKQKRRGK